MEENTRYKLEHAGDRFVETVEEFLGWLKNSTKGISLTYRIHCLEKDRTKSYARIGQRTVSLRRRHPHNELFSDEDLSQLFVEFDKADAELSQAKQEREARLYPRSEASAQPA
ncbi:hypothetical protein [Solidesulfovibrio magneticus]|uniref:Magnetosome protein Mad10 n=2 Tax=Bacteria TaxID=2 RepID=C4XP79_SOLM1|nr:hypothetical protein [Solidesulfovibrio magneticus]AGG16219.1 magnetosome protein Mad10 [bacterium FH-1]BAH77584.1 hypothetical protein DMR_40930 [Solidesulfovibrio magneticus RS-1]